MLTYLYITCKDDMQIGYSLINEKVKVTNPCSD